MQNRWTSDSFNSFIKIFSNLNQEMQHLLFGTQLLGNDSDLSLHGGGNTSVKVQLNSSDTPFSNALIIKASGRSMTNILPEDFVTLDIDTLSTLANRQDDLSDQLLSWHFKRASAPATTLYPSIETLLHVFLPHKYIFHTHPSAILALTNRTNNTSSIQEALGKQVARIPYARVGLELAKASLDEFQKNPSCEGLIIMNHGLVTWGETAQDAYNKTIQIVDKAEKFLIARKRISIKGQKVIDPETAKKNYISIAPIIRSCMSPCQDNLDNPCDSRILLSLQTKEILNLLASPQGKPIAETSPLTPDYLIRTRIKPLWIELNNLENADDIRLAVSNAIANYSNEYKAYLEKFQPSQQFETIYPTVILIPNIGVICAGKSEKDAQIALDITEQNLRVKQIIHETGGMYAGIDESHLIDMEFRDLQKAKVSNCTGNALQGKIALVTGGAGAIGMGVLEQLALEGCHIVCSDIQSENFENAVKSLQERFGNQVMGVTMDVTNEESVKNGFNEIIAKWGGIDIAVVNAGIAHVSPLDQMSLEAFQKLERVNVDGTLLTIRTAAQILKKQNSGGDIILISTKNVFAPGAKFGAYSATKAAAHQLARIAVLELAEFNIRVNMVAPDAVFSHGAKRSGLWAEVGPDRMKARGLDEAGLEEYYRSRNLLKAKITAQHVGKAVLFFVTHQTPTTGATIPVDGGLPDATPR